MAVRRCVNFAVMHIGALTQRCVSVCLSLRIKPVRRREFITLAGGMVALPLMARAQKPAIPVVGLLGAAIPDDAEVARNLAAFRQGLADTGFVEGRNVRIEYRWADGHNERLPSLAAELRVPLNSEAVPSATIVSSISRRVTASTGSAYRALSTA